MFRSLFLFLLMFLGCTPTPLTGTPQARDNASAQFRDALTQVDFDINDDNGVPEVSDAEIFGADHPSVESTYLELQAAGLIESGTLLARAASTVCTETQVGDAVSMTLLSVRGPSALKRLGNEWGSSGAANDHYVHKAGQLTPQNPATFWKVGYCSRDFDGAPYYDTMLLGIPGQAQGLTAKAVLYAHGTEILRAGAASTWDVDTTYDPMPMALSVVSGYLIGNNGTGTSVPGMIAIIPDGAGLGDSEIPRIRFLDRNSGTAHLVDGYSAAQQILATLGASIDELYNVGFSLGGHDIIGATLALENNGVVVSGTVTFGGVFQPERPFVEYYSSFPNLPPAMVISGLQAATAWDMGLLSQTSLSDVFVDPSVYGAFDGTYNLDGAANLFGVAGANNYTNMFAAGFSNQLIPGSELRSWLDSTSVVNDCLQSPLVVFNDINDIVVPAHFATEALVDWSANCPSLDYAVELPATASTVPHDQMFIDKSFEIGRLFATYF